MAPFVCPHSHTPDPILQLRLSWVESAPCGLTVKKENKIKQVSGLHPWHLPVMCEAQKTSRKDPDFTYPSYSFFFPPLPALFKNLFMLVKFPFLVHVKE